MEIKISSERELEAFAQKLAAKITPGTTLGLIGQLGAGKTTLVRHLLSAWKSKDQVSSPTFVLQHCYTSPAGRIEHWDLYRLVRAPEEIFEPAPADSVRIIEWCDKDPALMKEISCHLSLEFAGSPSSTARLLKLSPELSKIYIK